MNRVLIVDDDFDICEALQLVLEGRYQVEIAYNGEQALQRLAGEKFDAMVLDLMMPVMDGESLMAELKRRGIELPVVFASAATQLATRARQAGAAAWLSKPFEAHELEAALERALRKDRGPGGGSEPQGGTSRQARGLSLNVGFSMQRVRRLYIPVLET